MTLSRGPYSELDKMSLFQDLKLKRRKVDSRCSSDGESLADTNASSPDLMAPISPKMCDQGNNSQLQQTQTIESTQTGLDVKIGGSSDSDTLDDGPDHSGKQSPESLSRSHLNAASKPSTINETVNYVATSLPNSHNVSDKQYLNSTVTTINANIISVDGVISKKAVKLTSSNNNAVLNSTESTVTSNDNNDNNNNNNSETPANTSVIRLVGEERLPSPNQPAFSPPQHQQKALNIAQPKMSPHVTVLVTPTRMKNDVNQQSVTAPIQEIRKSSAIQMNSSAMSVVSIEANNNVNNNLSNCNTSNNNSNVNNSNNSGSNNNNNTITKINSIQRIESDSSVGIVNKNSPTLQKVQIVHTSAASTPQNESSRSVQISAINSFTHQHSPEQNKQQGSPKNFKFPVNLHAAITSPHPIRIKRERSPIHTISGQGMPVQSMPSQNPSITTVTPVTSGGQIVHPSIQLQHPIRDAAILFRVKNDNHMPGLIQATNPNRMVWNANTRINGVKPEIIGGSITGLRSPVTGTGHSPAASVTQSCNQTPARNTPTVIMGESCGVRTMVWGFESPSPVPHVQSQQSQQQPQSAQMQQHNSVVTQNHQSAVAGPSSNNEEAAHLLLSLGQSRPNEMRPLQTQTTMRSPHPLNMERLWAGDYSQLPAGQQMHALNLSSQQQWGGPIQPMKVQPNHSIPPFIYSYFYNNGIFSLRMNRNPHQTTKSSH